MLRFWAYRARREGKPIPRWQLHNARWTECRLVVAEEHEGLLGRTVKVARARSDRDADVFPPLLDAQLILADATRLVLSGIESEGGELGERAQTWVLHTSDHGNPTGPLRYWAHRQRRGGRLMRTDEIEAPEWVDGRFTLKEERDEWLGRTVRVGRLTKAGVGDVGGSSGGGSGVDALEPLIEAQLVMASEERLVLCGIERDTLTRCDRLQSWVLHLHEARGQQGEPAPKRGRAEMLPP